MEIGIWGDSITYGECDSEGLGWVGRFRNSFSLEEYVGVYNRGICGDTTKDLLKRFSTEAESIKPNKIVFAIGINDSKYPMEQTSNNVPLHEFKENMRSLIEQAKAYTKDIYIVGATKVDDAFALQSGTCFVNKDIQLYNDCLKELSSRLNFIDVFDVLDPVTDLHDGLHPNAGGYQKLFIEIAPKIK
ncbi:MAG: acyl-CoA thioesterase [Candidatus Kaiserbacteria bacterium]|nr:acyl-CoA thioesterase [Candidatus Kaiserbacteria bacterium]